MEKMTAAQFQDYIKNGGKVMGEKKKTKPALKGKDWSNLMLLQELETYLRSVWGDLETEYKFHPDRKWRSDYASPSRKILLEIEGGLWNNGRHTRPKGYQNDIEKYNSAQDLGFTLYRYSYDDLRKLSYQLHIQ